MNVHHGLNLLHCDRVLPRVAVNSHRRLGPLAHNHIAPRLRLLANHVDGLPVVNIQRRRPLVDLRTPALAVAQPGVPTARGEERGNVGVRVVDVRGGAGQPGAKV